MVTLTKEQKQISRKNNAKMRKKLGILGDANMVLHHIDKSLRYNNIERYIEWREEDVIAITRGEHTKLHYDDIFTEDVRYKMGWKRKYHKDKVPAKSHDDLEWRTKISDSLKGRKGSATGKAWFNNGIKETYAETCPEGFVKGRLPGTVKTNRAATGKYWFNNGIKETYSFECPEGFVKGRLKRRKDMLNLHEQKVQEIEDKKPLW